MKYKHIIVSKYGGPENLQLIEEEIPEPRAGEVRIKILTAGVSLEDILMRECVHPESLFKRGPFSLSWDIVGTIDKVGEKVSATSTCQIGDNAHFTWSGDTDVSKISGIQVFGDWLPLNAIKSESPDFFIYLGDIIYSDGRAAGKLPDAQTLGEFRQIYKDSRDVTALHDLLKKTSVYPLWDDHEVRSDWAGQTVDPTFFEIGKKSFDEYTQIRGGLVSLTYKGFLNLRTYNITSCKPNGDLFLIEGQTAYNI